MLNRNSNPGDKVGKRLVTVGFVALAIVLYFLSRAGVLGVANQRAAGYVLGVMLIIALGRAVMTELGVRRRSLWSRPTKGAQGI